MADIALDKDTGDVKVVNGRFVLLKGTDATSQRISIRLKFVLGEWILDERLGLPYFEDILVKNPDLTLLGGYFREAILTTPGVKELVSFSLSFDAGNRVLYPVFSYRGQDSDAIVEYDIPFIINAAAAT